MSGIGDEVTSVEAAQLPAPRPLTPLAAVGRAQEIEAVRRAFVGGAGPVTLVGPAGAGKTHLARAIASSPGAPRSTGGFDAAYFVEMEGAENGEDVVTLLAFALGFTNDALPPDLERAAERAGKALSARGTALVVLDGVDDIVAGAAPLARALSAHCRVLVTSQAPLGVMGERVVEVGPLSLDDAVALLVDVAGGDDAEALAQIAKGAGCMPASLVMAGRFIVERRAHPVAAELSRRVHGELAMLLDGALTQNLDDDDRSALLRLSPHRGPLDRGLVDVLVPERDPDDVVAALRAHGVLVGEGLVPAVRDRALDELAGRGELLGKRRDHAAAVAGRAFIEIMRADDAKTGAAALRSLERLRAGLEDAAAALLGAKSDDPDDDTRLLTIAIALDALAKKPASPAHVRLLEEALARAGAVVDKRLRARALEALGDHKKLAGRVHDARRDYLLALDLADNDDAALALLHRNVADLDLDAGELVSADDHARRAIAFARRAGSTRHMARATWTLGRIALRRGNAAQAEILLERAAAGFRADGDERFAARATFELGRCAEARGDSHAALALFRRALAACEPAGDVAFAERARVHLGLLSAHLGERGEAKGFLDAALESAVKRGDVRAERAVREHLARLT
jgi:tetratricopeptide (TPR) repeat protein